MDEQIKPVAWVMPSAMKALSAGGSAMVGGADQGIDLPLYSQQSIDALRAEVERLQSSYDQLYVHAESSYQARKDAEAEAEALRADAAAKARERWYFVITIPETEDGRGPAELRDSARLVYEVWDQLCVTHGRFSALPDAIDCCNEPNAERAAIDAARKGAE